MYVIISSRSGQYRSEIVDGMVPIEVYDYLFYGHKKACFTIAFLERPVKIRIVDEGPPVRESLISSKFLDHYSSLEDARTALHELANFRTLDVRLKYREACTSSSFSQRQP